MPNEEKSEVAIRTDRVTESFGRHAYSARTLFIGKRKINLLGIAVLLTAVGLSMLHTKKRPSDLSRETPPMPKTVTQISPGLISPRIYADRDLWNTPQAKKDRKRAGTPAPKEIQIISFAGQLSLPVGSEISAVLVSGATDGLVKAKLLKPLIHDGEPILPSGTALMGRGRSGEERLFVEFTRAVPPSGETIAIRAQAFDESDRIQGLKGAVVSRRTKKMAGAVAFGMMGGLAEGFKDSGGSIYLPRRPSTRDAALNGASRAALDQSKAYLDEMKNSSNIIEVKSGQEILVIVDEPKTKNEGD